MIVDKDYDEWSELIELPPLAARAVADWLADVLTVVRVLHGAGVTGLGESLLWHVEQAYTGVTAELYEGALPATALTVPGLAAWVKSAADRDAVLTELADEFGSRGLLNVLNRVSDGEGLHYLASSQEGMPYWHVEQAHRAVLTLLTGSADDAEALHALWSGNQEDTAWNRAKLAEQKRDASVIVTVAADLITAKVTLPDGTECEAGQVGGGDGPFWVADEVGEVVGHAPTWGGAAEVLATRYGYTDAPVLVEWPQDKATGVATPTVTTS